MSLSCDSTNMRANISSTKVVFMMYRLFSGFKLLKLALGGDGFYRVGHPNCFVTDNCDAERHALQSVWPESHLFLCVFHILQQIWRWLWDSHHGIKKDDCHRLMAVAKQLVYSDSEETFNSIWTSFNGCEDAQTYSRYCR